MTKPNQSGRPARGSCDSRTRVAAIAIATRQIGMLTKKIHRHERPLVSTPPRTGPTATATPVVAPNTPNATPRSRPWNAEAMSASAVANIAAPPMPWKARASCRNVDVLGGTAGDRADHEQRRTDHEHLAAAVEVGERAGGQQQRREAERVGVDHPLQVGEARAELALDVGERDVHDRDVEQQDEDAEADRGQRPPLGVAAGPRLGRRGGDGLRGHELTSLGWCSSTAESSTT